MSTFKAGGKTYNVSDFGGKLGAGELKTLAEKSGLTAASIIDRFTSAGGSVSTASKAYVAAPATTTTTTTTTATTTPTASASPIYAAGGAANSQQQSSAQSTPETTLFQNLFDFQKGLEITKNEGLVNSTTIRADADKEIARIDADARKYGYELGLEGTKYGADKEAEWRQAVANIEVQGKLNLQPIINAGLERVAEIEGQSARDVAEITGSYGLKSTQERASADKSIAQMQLAGGMYGLINSIFG